MLGYKEQEIKVGTQSQLSIKLQEDAELIDEVVVVGYAAQKKVNLTGSVFGWYGLWYFCYF